MAVCQSPTCHPHVTPSVAGYRGGVAWAMTLSWQRMASPRLVCANESRSYWQRGEAANFVTHVGHRPRGRVVLSTGAHRGRPPASERLSFLAFGKDRRRADAGVHAPNSTTPAMGRREIRSTSVPSASRASSNRDDGSWLSMRTNRPGPTCATPDALNGAVRFLSSNDVNLTFLRRPRPFAIA